MSQAIWMQEAGTSTVFLITGTNYFTPLAPTGTLTMQAISEEAWNLNEMMPPYRISETL
jgi:hypothetical protein